MLQPKDIIILALAIYKGVVLINKDEGPYEIFLKFRRWLGIEQRQIEELNEFGITELVTKEVATTEFSKLIHCPFCLSVWLGAMFFLTYKYFKPLYLLLGVLGLTDLFIVWVNDKR